MVFKNGLPCLLALAAAAPAIVIAQDDSAALTSPVEAAAAPAAAPETTATVALAEAPAATPEPAPDERRANRLIEEIVVTAQKREENLQDVPISVTAFSAAALDAKGLDDPRAVGQATPGVYYGSTVNFAIIYIRGVGSDAFLPDSDPSVATYIDGIYFPFANGLSQSFGAVERVEVLKGPQGTLFGRNSTGGAFNTITKSPSQTPETSVMASWEEDEETLRTRIYTNVPVTDSLAFSVAGTYSSGEGYYTGSRGTGQGLGRSDLPRENSKGARIKLRWDITDDLDLNLAGFKYYQGGLASSAMPNVDPSALTQFFNLALNQSLYTPPPDYQVNVEVPAYFKVDNEVAYGQLNWKPEWFDFKLLASDQLIKTDNWFDFDGTEAAALSFFATNQFADVKTAEVQFLSNGVTGPDWLTWIAGAFYLDQESGFPLNQFSAGGLEISDLSIADTLGLPAPLIDFLSAQASGFPDGVEIGLVSLLGTKSTAYFTQFTIDFTDEIHLTLGGRYQEEDRRAIASNTSIVNLANDHITLIRRPSQKKSTTNFSPKVSLAYDIFDDVMVYASYTEGYKSGTFNTVNIYDEIEYIKPELVTTTEAGFKAEFFNGLVRFNAAAFENKIDDLQVQFISLLSGGAVSLENAGGAKIRGVEFDFQLSPMPDLNPGLVIGGGGTFLDSEYTSYRNGSGYAVNAQGNYAGAGLYNFATGDYTGNQVTRTPKFSGTFNVNQLISIGDGDIEIGASIYHNDGFYFVAQNTPNSRQPSYQVIDAQISYIYNPWKARITLFGKNLGEEVYAYSQFHLDTGRLDYLAPPRTYGVRVNWDF